MNLLNKAYFIVLIIIAITLALILIMGFIQGALTYNQCKEKCRLDDECLAFQRINNGAWNLNDVCILIYKDRLEAFRLNEKMD